MTMSGRSAIPSHRTLCYLRRILYNPFPECRRVCVRPSLRPSLTRRHIHHSKHQFASAVAQQQEISEEFPEDMPIPIRLSRRQYIYSPEQPTYVEEKTLSELKETVQVPSPQPVHPPVHPRTCIQWISMKKWKAATYWWRHARNRGFSEKWVTKVAGRLFRSLNDNKRAGRVPALFHRLSNVPESVDTNCLNACIEAFVLKQRPERAISLFNKYCETTLSSSETYVWTVKALVQLKDLEAAENLLRQCAEDGFGLAPTACAALLAGVRQQKGSMEEMERLFEWMRSTPVKRKVLYGIMIEEALITGHPEKAKEYVRMMHADGIKVDAKVLGVLIVLQAKAKDLDAMAASIKRLKEGNFRLRTNTFNQLLTFYTRYKGTESIEYFFDILVADGVRTNTISYNIMIRAFLLAGDSEGAFRWLDRLKADGFQPPAEVFNTFFDYFIRRSAADTTILRRLYGAMYKWDADVVNDETRALLELRERGLSSPPIDADQEASYQEIQNLIWEGKSREAIKAFRKHLATDAVPARKTVTAIIQLCYNLPENMLAEARALLRIAQARGAHVDKGIISAMSEAVRSEAAMSNGNYAKLVKMVLAAYDYMDHNALGVNHHVTVAAVHKLSIKRDPVGVVYIANEVFKSPWGRKIKWPIELLNVLLRSYIRLVDIKGVQWVVEQIAAWEIVPDQKIIDVLRSGRLEFTSPTARAEMEEALQKCKDLRERKRAESMEQASTVLKAMKEHQIMAEERARRHALRKLRVNQHDI